MGDPVREILRDNIKELLRAQVVLSFKIVPVDTEREILCHLAALNSVNAHLLKGGRETHEGVVSVELSTKFQTRCPREYRRDRIC